MKVWLGWLLRRDESQRAKPANAKGQTHAVQCGEMSFLSTHYIKWHAPLPPVNWEPSILWDVCIPLSLNALYLASLQQQEAYWYALWLRCPRPHFRTAPLTLIMVSKALGKSYRSYSEAVSCRPAEMIHCWLWASRTSKWSGKQNTDFNDASRKFCQNRTSNAGKEAD